MGDDTLWGWATIGVGFVIVAAYLTGHWSTDLAKWGGVIALLAGIFLLLIKYGFYASVREQLQAMDDGSLERTQGIDRIWEDLQTWWEADYRDKELAWNHKEHFHTILPVPIDDPEFYLLTLLAKVKESEQQIHFVLEMRTGKIIHYAHTDDSYNFSKNEPFKPVPWVQELRMLQALNVMDRSEIKQRLRSRLRGAGVGELAGNYTPVDDEMRDAMEDAAEEAADDLGDEVDIDG